MRTEHPAITILKAGRLIQINAAAGLSNVSCRNPASIGPVAIPRENVVNINACAIGTSLIQRSLKWKITVNNIGKNAHVIPFTAATMSSRGNEFDNKRTI